MSTGIDDGVEVILFAHVEGNFLGGSIASVLRAAAYAEARNLAVGLTAVLYAPTPLTLKTAAYKLDSRWRVLHLAHARLDQARNEARLAVRRRFAAFVDGYDLWCEKWLYDAYVAAASYLAVWRPEVLLTFGNDFHKPEGYSAVFQPLHLSTPQLLLANNHLPSGFVAPLTILKTQGWPCAGSERAAQGADRWWSCEVAASGYEHRAIPSTFHYRRYPYALLETPRSPANSREERIGPTRLSLLQMPQLAFAARPGFGSLDDDDIA
jgi:hypothetical protein